jgi:hypothetical protein
LEGLGIENVGIFYDHLEYLTFIWYIFPVLVCLDQEKSGNPVSDTAIDAPHPIDIPSGYDYVAAYFAIRGTPTIAIKTLIFCLTTTNYY